MKLSLGERARVTPSCAIDHRLWSSMSYFLKGTYSTFWRQDPVSKWALLRVFIRRAVG